MVEAVLIPPAAPVQAPAPAPAIFRKTVFDHVLPHMRRDQRLVVLVGDMGFGAIDKITAEFPDRLINLGMMEQGMVGIAAGLAIAGMKPVIYSMPNFLAFRALEQIRNDVVLQGQAVKLVATGVNDYFRFLGGSHCCGQDDKTLMNLVGVRVHDPYEPLCQDFAGMVDAWISDDQPAYLRV
jgi:transketolase